MVKTLTVNITIGAFVDKFIQTERALLRVRDVPRARGFRRSPLVRGWSEATALGRSRPFVSPSLNARNLRIPAVEGLVLRTEIFRYLFRAWLQRGCLDGSRHVVQGVG
jgi:hypothetical protein